MNLQGLKTKAVLKAAKTVFLLRQHSPEILVGVGIVGVIVGTVATTKALTKAEVIIDSANSRFDHINLVKENSDPKEYTEVDFQKDKVIVATQTTVELVKTMAPSVSLVVVSVICIVGGHNILRKRNMALIAAYKVLEKGFASYRSRVIEDYGEETDYNYRHGIRKEQIEEKIKDPETGKTKKITTEKTSFDPNHVSIYARYFDESSPQFSNVAEYNLTFLLHKQNYWNNVLHSKGLVFLNEVYKDLGIPISEAGQYVGWAITKDGDNFIDFGIFTDDRGRTNPRSFVNGHEQTILLDFNVNGVVVDLI